MYRFRIIINDKQITQRLQQLLASSCSYSSRHSGFTTEVYYYVHIKTCPCYEMLLQEIIWTKIRCKCKSLKNGSTSFFCRHSVTFLSAEDSIHIFDTLLMIENLKSIVKILTMRDWYCQYLKYWQYWLW